MFYIQIILGKHFMLERIVKRYNWILLIVIRVHGNHWVYNRFFSNIILKNVHDFVAFYIRLIDVFIMTTRMLLSCHCAKYWIMSTNGWTIFVILRFCVAHLIEFRRWSKHTSSKPYGISLHLMWNHLNINWFRLEWKQYCEAKVRKNSLQSFDF